MTEKQRSWLTPMLAVTVLIAVISAAWAMSRQAYADSKTMHDMDITAIYKMLEKNNQAACRELDGIHSEIKSIRDLIMRKVGR